MKLEERQIGWLPLGRFAFIHAGDTFEANASGRGSPFGTSGMRFRRIGVEMSGGWTRPGAKTKGAKKEVSGVTDGAPVGLGGGLLDFCIIFVLGLRENLH